jgi:hypothetical protein
MKKSRTDPPSSARTAQHVPEDNEHSRTATSGALRLRFLALRHQYWWVYELLLELCNYLDRTRTLISHRATPMIHTGHLYGVDHQGQTIQCSRTLGRTQDIQDWRYLRPRATRLDCQVFLEGWNAGSRYTEHTQHSCIAPGDPDGETPCMAPFDQGWIAFPSRVGLLKRLWWRISRIIGARNR